MIPGMSPWDKENTRTDPKRLLLAKLAARHDLLRADLRGVSEE